MKERTKAAGTVGAVAWWFTAFSLFSTFLPDTPTFSPKYQKTEQAVI